MSEAWRFARHRGVGSGGLIVLAVLFAAAAAPWLTGYAPMRLDVAQRLLPPSAQHLFGTDEFGRDVYSLVLFGGRISPLAGGVTMRLTSVGGVVIGLAAASIGGSICSSCASRMA